MATRATDSRVNDLFRVESDITGIKKFIAGVSVAVISLAASGGMWVGNIATRVSTIEESNHEIEGRQRASDISSARIETKLANIELVLIEIKRGMKP